MHFGYSRAKFNQTNKLQWKIFLTSFLLTIGMNLPILYFSVCLQQQHDMVTIMKTSSKQAAAEILHSGMHISH